MSSEHINLASFIKQTHKKLREEAKILGTEEAWINHCKNDVNLEKYSSAMANLAVNYWDKNCENSEKVKSRVTWIYLACKEYFSNIKKHRDKELRIMMTYVNHPEQVSPEVPTASIQPTYEMLDVGSCYNPFKEYVIFHVTPIDIAPANADVLNCDFLNVVIHDKTVIIGQKVLQLQKGSFDIIVFSLLLEYFPSPAQRLACCLNAYELLKTEGILSIITPDSNHVGSNAKIFKSWQYILAKLGFIRVKYEKLPYLHCMLFRKAKCKKVAQRWAEIHQSEGLFNEIYIPQDLKESHTENEKLLEKGTNRDEWCQNTFLEEVGCNMFD